MKSYQHTSGRIQSINEENHLLKVSVIVPTWNEEAWLPRLIECLRSSPHVTEIIVADNNSSDATIQLAERNACTVISGGRPAEARNKGALEANGNILLFIDADVWFNPKVIDSVIHHFSTRNLVGLHYRIKPLTRSWFVRICYSIMNSYFAILSFMGFPQAVGSFMAVRKDAFSAINGFSEDIEVGEDADLFRRLSRIGNVVFDRKCSVWVSPRRLNVESRIGFCLKCFFWASMRLMGMRISVIGYRWLHYPKHLANHETVICRTTI